MIHHKEAIASHCWLIINDRIFLVNKKKRSFHMLNDRNLSDYKV